MKPVPGEVIAVSNLAGRRARDITAYIEANHSPYIRLLECRRKGSVELLVIELDVEVAPRRPIKIARTETFALWCNSEKDVLPEVIPLRDDFPIDQLHVTVDAECTIASLCLWAIPVEDLLARFTPFMFLARLKEWLELAAEGRLHQTGQGAEPVLAGYNMQAIMPHAEIDPARRYVATGFEALNDQLIVRFLERTPGTKQAGDNKFVLLPLKTDTVVGRAVRFSPNSLAELAAILSEHGCDLLPRITSWLTSVRGEGGLDKAVPVIHVTFPKSSAPDRKVEGCDTWAFAISQTVAQLGEAIGTFSAGEGHVVPIIGAKANEDAAAKIRVEPMLVLRELGAAELPVLAGIGEIGSPKFAAIGVGALGSKVVELSVRSGFGEWAIFDKDILLPHNPVRHILGSWAIGESKAHHVGSFVNSLVPGKPVKASFYVDVCDRDSLGDEALAALHEATLVLDMSASVAVARDLALMPDLARCASMFFNPGATDVGVLIEDAERTRTLIELEASFYAALTENEALKGHLSDPTGQPIRYGNGCRDVTATISPDQVSVLGGFACRALRQYSTGAEALARVWRIRDDGSVSVAEIPTPVYKIEAAGEWSVGWSEAVLARVAQERRADLPNETGGILLGMVDFKRKIIRVSAAVEAPPDSVKRPHYFERGKTGLERRLREIGDQTAGQLRYVGEWHSHPDGCPASPSEDDDRLFSKLAEIFTATGEPHVMAIVGAGDFFWRLGVNADVHEEVFAVLA